MTNTHQFVDKLYSQVVVSTQNINGHYHSVHLYFVATYSLYKICYGRLYKFSEHPPPPVEMKCQT